jgi:membrane protein DedA with SNARE-associated domain
MFEHFTSIQAVIDYFNAIDVTHIYLLVFALMFVESSFVPFPSEVVIPPAAMVASAGGSHLSIPLIVAAGTLGALTGSFFNYYLGRLLGRPVVHKLAGTRLAHACLIDLRKVEQAEAYFVQHGNASTFVGRLIPVGRQLISLPAGMAKMSVPTFALYTTLGALLWIVALAAVGYVCGKNVAMFESIFHELTIALIALGALFVAYLIYNGLKKK